MHFEKGDYDNCTKDCDAAVERGRELRADYKTIARALTRKGTSLVKQGKLRLLGITTKKPTALLPGVPPLAEAADLPNYDIGGWNGLLLPAGTPQPILDRLATEARTIMLSDEMKARLDSLAMDPIGGRPAEFAAYQVEEMRKWAELIRRRGIRLE